VSAHEPLRLGVVGLGIRGFWLAHLARTLPATRLVAVADLRAEMRAEAARVFPDVKVLDSDVALGQHSGVEAVIVATGDRFHAANARAALEAGKPALIEKPLAQSFADLQEIARLSRETGLPVGTYLELAFAPLYARAAEILAAGELGRILAADVIDRVGRDKSQFFAREKTRRRENVVSLVLQKGVHSLDLLNGLVGASPRRVYASGALLSFGGTRPAGLRCRDCPEAPTCPHTANPRATLDPPGVDFPSDDDLCVWSEACNVEDLSLLTIRYDNGALATYREVHFDPGYGLDITLWGERGRMLVSADHDTGEARIEVAQRHTREARCEQPTDNTGHGSADEDLLADFAAAVREGRPPRQGLRQGFESAAIAIATRQSIDTRLPVDLPVLGDG
jgi:predicted dehydrogenase